jgi:hypothetical protein
LFCRILLDIVQETHPLGVPEARSFNAATASGNSLRRRQRREQLQAESASVNREISEHPFASGPMRAAQSVIDSMRGREPEAIDADLQKNSLPSTQEVGRITASGMGSWARLHRVKMKIEKRIRRLN